MSEFFNKLTGTAPELLLMFLFVYMFLRAMKDRDQLFVSAVKEISEQHLKAREESKKVIEFNSQQTIRSTEALATMTEVLRELKERKV